LTRKSADFENVFIVTKKFKITTGSSNGAFLMIISVTSCNEPLPQ